jgi:hypothetical protein
MIFLPIVARELRVAARRPGTFWMRAAMALGATAIEVFLYLANIASPAQFVAQKIFFWLMVLTIFFCLFAGRRSTADCLSQEKREGTLGLLFLTDLKGYDIVLGKLAATSLNGFYSLLAVFPVMAVPILLGGITPGEFPTADGRCHTRCPCRRPGLFPGGAAVLSPAHVFVPGLLALFMC